MTSLQIVHFVGQGVKIINNRYARYLHDSKFLETLSQWAYLTRKEVTVYNKGTQGFLEVVGR